MKYTCTRNSKIEISASEAIVKGISDDGGLFVPSSFPIFSLDDIKSLINLDYPSRYAKIMSSLLDEFSYEELFDYANKAYSQFDGDVCPLVKVEDGLYMAELWHGPTCSCEDVSLATFPYLLRASKKKLSREDGSLALIATSGDDGVAAMESFRGFEGASVAAFYPSDLTGIQRGQIVTHDAKNAYAYGVRDEYDGIRSRLERVLCDEDVAKALKERGLSAVAANSANWGVLAPKIVFYFSSYCDLVASDEITLGDKVNFVIPTGSFATAIAGYYAYRMGLPVNEFIVATNANNILVDFFNDGEFDVKRDLFKTSSPSMDVLMPCELERYIFEITDRDDEEMTKVLESLKKDGRFALDKDSVRADVFEAGWADEEDTKNAIETFFDLDDYIMDTHTAVAASVYNDYSCETDDETPTVVFSTANPYKFSQSVLNALGSREKDVYKSVVKLYNLTALDCPQCIVDVEENDEIHTEIIERNEMKKAVLDTADVIENKTEK